MERDDLDEPQVVVSPEQGTGNAPRMTHYPESDSFSLLLLSTRAGFSGSGALRKSNHFIFSSLIKTGFR